MGEPRTASVVQDELNSAETALSVLIRAACARDLRPGRSWSIATNALIDRADKLRLELHDLSAPALPRNPMIEKGE